MKTEAGRPDSRNWPLAAALGIFAAGFLTLAYPWLSGAVTIPWDAKAQFYPQLSFMAQSLARGEAPFWTPHVFGGWPQIADPQSLLFSPVHLALAAFDPTPSLRAFDAATFALLFAGCLGLLLFFRDRGWHPAGAVVAALAFSFGGSAASRLQHTGQIASLALLPLALWLLARALDRRSLPAGAAAGLIAAFIALGRDQVALLSLYVLAGFVAMHWLAGPGRRARWRASIAPLATGAAVATLVLALPILMSALLAASSNRPAIDFVSAGRGSLHPAHLLTLVFADLYGAADPRIDYWGPSSFPWGPTDLFLAQNMGQLYLGALPMAALLVATLRGDLWTREIRFFTAAALLTLLYSLGWYTPFFRAAFELLPGVALFRRPADASFVLCGLAALLGGYALHVLIAKPPARSAAIAATLFIGLAGCIGIWLAARVGFLRAALIPVVTGVIGFGVAALAIAVVPRITMRFGRHAGTAAAALFALAMTADLAWHNGPNESTGLPPAHYDAMRRDTGNETVRVLKSRLAATAGPDRRDRVELPAIGYHWPNISLVHGFDHTLGHNPLRLADFARATGVGDTIAVADQRTFSPLFPSYRSPMADLFGLRFIASGVPIERIDSSLQPGDLPLVARTAEAYVYENPRALPRVFVAANWMLADFDRMIHDGRWPAIDLRRTVLLERPVEAPSPSQGGTARIASYRNTQVVVEVEAPSGGILVLNDVWHPWWRASVNGKATEILKANVLFRAIAVPPGESRVVFSFHPVAGALEQLRSTIARSAATPR